MFKVEIQDNARIVSEVSAETLESAVSFAELQAPYHQAVRITETLLFTRGMYRVPVASWFEGRQLDLSGRS